MRVKAARVVASGWSSWGVGGDLGGGVGHDLWGDLGRPIHNRPQVANLPHKLGGLGWGWDGLGCLGKG